MGWKDTVISWERMRMVFQEQDKEGVTNNMFRMDAIVETQAEITWDIAHKAGYREGTSDKDKWWETVHNEALLTGRKEVVDWIEPLFHFYDCYTADCPIYTKWKSKKKEWGIE